MNMLLTFYILNTTLLLLHEIESAYEQEWDLLHLPGKITGFLLMHIPIILILFYGAVEIAASSKFGLLLGIISGAGGLLPWVVHKVFVKRKNHFNRMISNLIIYLNIAVGSVTIILSLRTLVNS